MQKWADYCITAVRFSNDRKYITHLMIREDLGKTISGKEETISKNTAIKFMEKGGTFCTILWRDSTKAWKFGADVSLYETKSGSYLRTDKNAREQDNLENLPEF